MNIPMQLSHSLLTGRISMTRKATINEGQQDERRVYQSYYGINPAQTPEKTLEGALVIEGLSPAPGEPLSLRVTTSGGETFACEGGKQVVELLTLLIDAASYAEGIEPREYAETILNRAAARV